MHRNSQCPPRSPPSVEAWNVFDTGNQMPVVPGFAKQSEFQIIANARDGAEAVQKARQLQPDLILPDVGLPTLNGIEAARRIEEVCATSKIVFVSENRSPDIAGEALSTGAGGYVVK